MGKRGFVSANREDSEPMIRDEAMAEIRRLAELMNEPTPIYDSLVELYALRSYLGTDDPFGEWDEPQF